MGTTPVPLKILLVGLEKGEEFEALEAQGHLVDTPGTEAPSEFYDLILGPRCWRLLPEQMKFLPLAIKEGRAHAKAVRPKVAKKKAKA